LTIELMNWSPMSNMQIRDSKTNTLVVLATMWSIGLQREKHEMVRVKQHGEGVREVREVT
jgi:hypothetical protein